LLPPSQSVLKVCLRAPQPTEPHHRFAEIHAHHLARGADGIRDVVCDEARTGADINDPLTRLDLQCVHYRATPVHHTLRRIHRFHAPRRFIVEIRHLSLLRHIHAVQ
jgi:hypothetical protein